ncbi:hypothetical protein JXM83_05415, partial [Candidatus Woesearchaeota archaeon]|nr:hypothetical protein [Candidatus Delongbacteria bacterium]MBN2881460.1 hypothetical protein [Candidatus Woesearchaeota archaeon]
MGKKTCVWQPMGLVQGWGWQTLAFVGWYHILFSIGYLLHFGVLLGLHTTDGCMKRSLCCACGKLCFMQCVVPAGC